MGLMASSVQTGTCCVWPMRQLMPDRGVCNRAGQIPLAHSDRGKTRQHVVLERHLRFLVTQAESPQLDPKAMELLQIAACIGSRWGICAELGESGAAHRLLAV